MASGRGRRKNVVKQRKQASSMRSFYIMLGVVAAIGVAAIAWQTQRAPANQTRYVDVQPGTAEGYLYGNPDAPVTILEFADFQCPACGTWATVQKPDVVKRLIETGKANLRFFDFPLNIHPNANQAHNAAACAGAQNKFWPMHDAIFAGQAEWSNDSRPKKHFERYAQGAGLDVSAWNRCYEDATLMPRIVANQKEGERLGVRQTPTFVVGRRLVPGVVPSDDIVALVDSALAEKGAPVDSASR